MENNVVIENSTVEDMIIGNQNIAKNSKQIITEMRKIKEIITKDSCFLDDSSNQYIYDFIKQAVQYNGFDIYNHIEYHSDTKKDIIKNHSTIIEIRLLINDEEQNYVKFEKINDEEIKNHYVLYINSEFGGEFHFAGILDAILFKEVA